jgi:hypothetical protein
VTVGPKIFISHSNRDLDWVQPIHDQIEAAGGSAYLAAHDHVVGMDLAGKILTELEASHAMVVLLTKSGADSNYVQQEIGAALARKIPVIPLVTDDVTDAHLLGMLAGTKRIRLDLDDPREALLALTENVAALTADLHAFEVRRALEHQKVAFDAELLRQRQLTMAIGIFAGALAIALIVLIVSRSRAEAPDPEVGELQPGSPEPGTS